MHSKIGEHDATRLTEPGDESMCEGPTKMPRERLLICLQGVLEGFIEDLMTTGGKERTQMIWLMIDYCSWGCPLHSTTDSSAFGSKHTSTTTQPHRRNHRCHLGQIASMVSVKHQ
jgi:hypothetical protein